MKREILFRGLSANGKWIEGLPTFDFNYIFNDYQFDSPDNFEVDPETVGEFTGITDVKKNKVWEHDIIENVDTKDLQLVYWNEEKAAWYCKYLSCDRIVSLSDSIGNLNIVVGNIHDNFNLIK